MTAVRPRRVLAVLAVAAVLTTAAVAAVSALFGTEGTRITAHFDRTIGLHEGSDVTVLGVTVGTVDRITPQSGQVSVEMTLRPGIKVPADARAVVVTPSIVSGRHVQLTPAWTGGPQLADGALIPRERTAVPLDIDQLYDSVAGLAEALGPDGANADGALADLLDVSAANLDGNGRKLGTALEHLGSASRTLGDSSEDLFGTVTRLQELTTMLKENDEGVRTAEQQLAEVSSFLAADKEELATALAELGTALGQVETFVADNREAVGTSVERLTGLTRTLADQRASLAETLDTLPLAAGNVLNAYNPATGTFDGRANLTEISAADAAGLLGLPPAGTFREAEDDR
ncbi:MCE family protein [Streptomyces sp. YIM 98790]|uniref:MCE family protein n=1 Tax=Streptomyces sp. YIM 98790 TaxID=2689077 RepID=UPI00140D803F|nr:MCE family protein [Streptomyces sp. YIM 98790]